MDQQLVILDQHQIIETPQTHLSDTTHQMVAVSENKKNDKFEYAHIAIDNEYIECNFSSLQLLAIQKDEENHLKIQTEIKLKVIFAVLFILSSIITIYLLCNEESAEYKIIGTEIGIIFFLFHSNWLYLIFSSNGMHRIEVITSKIKPDYGNIIFPVQIKEYEHMPIKSMSQLLALRGTSVHSLFNVMCLTINGVLIGAAILTHWIDLHQYGNIDTFFDAQYIELFLSVCGSLTIPLMATFEANPHSKCHIALHYFGVFLMIISLFSYCIQSNWNIFSVAILCCALFSFVLWIIFAKYYPDDISSNRNDNKDNEEYIKRKTHSISVQCIVMETIGCIMVTVNNTLYVYNLKNINSCG
eukprot:2780_1